MSKSKKESLKKLDNQLEKDIKKFKVLFDAFTDDEKILYEYCMQLEGVVNTLKQLKENKNEKENNS